MRQPTRLLVAAAAVALFGASEAHAAKHQKAPAEPAAQRCRDAKGAFSKCAPGQTGAAAAPGANAAAAEKSTAKSARNAASRRPAMGAAAAAPGANASARARTPAPAGGVSARCRDGTMSHSQQRSGACSRHGGVASWM